MNQTWKISIVTFAALIAVALALVIYGVTTHKEAGLMRACVVEPAGSYDYEGECFDVRLEGDGPFEVGILYDDGSSMDYTTVLEKTVASVNRRLGGELLIARTGGCAEETICYYPEQPYSSSWRDNNGTASHHRQRIRGRDVLVCRVETKNTGLIGLEYVVLEHELLHCLGLDHDDFDMSIMRENQKLGGTNPWITDFDKKLLRKTYNIQ